MVPGFAHDDDDVDVSGSKPVEQPGTRTLDDVDLDVYFHSADKLALKTEETPQKGMGTATERKGRSRPDRRP